MFSRNTRIVAALALVDTVGISAAWAQNSAKAPSAVAAKVNGVVIPQSRIDLLMKARVAQGQPDSPEMRKAILDELISREILAQEATKKGLDKNSEIATQIDLSRQGILAGAFVQDYFKANPVSEDAMKGEYDKAKAQWGSKEYKAHHILVKTENEAKDIIAQIKKGAKFEKLASEKSEDTGSKARGGELEWTTPATYVKPFSEALVKLKKGETTQTPVQSQFGWHIIRLDDERALKAPPFDEVKPRVQEQMQQQALHKLVADLRAKAKIE